MKDSELLRLRHCMDEPLNGSNLRSIFLLLTRSHFSSPKNHGLLESSIGCFVYDDDPAKRTLDIELSHNFIPNKSVKVPAIYVGMDQGTTFSKVDFNNHLQFNEDNSGWHTGKLATTAVAFIHLAPTLDQALLMAESSTAFFMGVRDNLKTKLNLSSFDIVSLSPAALIEKSPTTYFRVDLQCALSFNFVVSVNLESHRLKKFNMSLQ